MKILKRILLGLLVIILVIQVPFVYRRYKMGQLAEKIAQANAGRTVREDPKYKEYKGIIHAHTSLGGHSTGGFDELINAANANDLDFVLMTEHWSDAYDTSALTLNGVYGKTLFVGGNEIDTADGDRFLMIPGSADAAGLRNMPTADVIEKLHHEGRAALITYPEKFRSWDSPFDADEVFSVHTAAKSVNPFTALFDIIWSYPPYPQLTLASYFRRPDVNLAKFDEVSKTQKIGLFAGTDAHSNIGFHLFGDDAGNKLINLKIDPYATTFGIVRMHIFLEQDEPLNRETVVQAVRTGHCFIGFDALGDSSGFYFSARNRNETVAAGDVLHPFDGVVLTSSSPIASRFRVFKDGDVFYEASNVSEISVSATENGAYRVEVYRDDLGPPFDKMPWILSNPIYVR